MLNAAVQYERYSPVGSRMALVPVARREWRERNIGEVLVWVFCFGGESHIIPVLPGPVYS